MTYQIQDLPASFKTLRHAKEHIARMSVSERVELVRYGKTKTIGIYKS